MKRLALPALAALIVAACAETSIPEDAGSHEKQYRTGSNLPVGERDRGVTTVDPGQVQDEARSSQRVMKKPGTG